MQETPSARNHFFDYLRLAKQELRALCELHPEFALLSARELEVFDQLLSDKTLTEIADELFLSHSSVHFHCKNIYRKLQLSSRRQLLMTYKEFYQ